MPDLVVKLLSEGTDWLSLLMNFIVTIAGVGVGAFCTYFLYNKEKKDKEQQQIKELETKQVRAANELIIHLWATLRDSIKNNETIDENRTKIKNLTLYVAERNYNWDTVKENSKIFIDTLPCLYLNAVMLDNSIKLSQNYRGQGEDYIKKENINGYNEISNYEYEQNKFLIKYLSTMLLIIYDYAVSKWGKNYTILKISNRDPIVNTWKYLDDNFTENLVKKNMQYEFRNEEIVNWFFGTLKNEHKKKVNLKNDKK